ncbi:MAG: hypothetical protein WBV95_18085 [Desulfobacterales bacterium]
MKTGQSFFFMDHIDDLFQFRNAFRQVDAELFRMFATFRGHGHRFEDEDSRTVSGDLSVVDELSIGDDPPGHAIPGFDRWKHETIGQFQVAQPIGLKHGVH